MITRSQAIDLFRSDDLLAIGAEADAVRRILPPAEFGRWFTAFLPHVEMEPTQVSDVTDGKAYHLAGLNLSRAWMLEGIV